MRQESQAKTPLISRAWIAQLALWLALLPVSAVIANEDPTPWQEAYSEDGRIQMHYRLSEQPTAEGAIDVVLEYRASFVGRFDLASSLAKLEDIQQLKIVEEVEQAEVLRQVSNNQRLVYFSSKGRWPFPGVDSVLRMTRTLSQDNSTAFIELVADPTAMEDRGHKRMSRFSVIYSLEHKPNGELEVSVHSSKAPPFKVPRFLLNSVLPDAAFDQMNRLMDILGGNQP